MTGREHMHLYAGLRGVPVGEVPHMVDMLLDGCGLRPVADKVIANGVYELSLLTVK